MYFETYFSKKLKVSLASTLKICYNKSAYIIFPILGAVSPKHCFIVNLKFVVEEEKKMHKNRGLYVFASAIIWSTMLWGVAQIKPVIFHPPDIDAPIIDASPELPRPTPPPKPPEDEEIPLKKPKIVVKRAPPTIATDETTPVEIVTDINLDPGPNTGTSLGSDAGVGTIPLTSIALPPQIEDVVVVRAPRCEERAIMPLPQRPFNVERAYPTRLEAQGITGTVHAKWQIDEHGDPIDIIIDSSTHSGFEDAVIREGMRMKFRPARRNCENIEGTYALNVVFEFKDE